MVWVKRIFKGLLVFVVLVGLSLAGLGLYARDQFGLVLDRCVGLDEVDNRYNPIGLLDGAAACARTGRIDDAVGLYVLGGAYGRFDMRRVQDRTAHQVMSVAMLTAFGGLDEEVRKAFEDGVAAVTSDPARHARTCAAVRRIGHPTYKPLYMTMHGMGNFTGTARNGDGMVKGFHADAAWQEVLIKWAKCPPTDGEIR